MNGQLIRTDYTPLDLVLERHAPRNPKRHDLPEIQASIRRFGFVAPCLMDERTDRLVAGHGRSLALAAMREAGDAPPSGVQTGEHGWMVPVNRGWASRSDLEAEAYLVADNELTRRGDWDRVMLADMLGDQDHLDGTGFDEQLLDELIQQIAHDIDTDEGDDGQEGDPDGTMVALTGVTVGEPDYTPVMGQVWALGRHRLVVAEVMTGWPLWAPLLSGEAIFAPYPSLLAPHTEVAQQRPLVLVQPDRYLAGWILTKWERLSGRPPTVVETS